MNGESTTYSKLLSDVAFTSLLTDISGQPALSVGIVEPTQWTKGMSTCSIFSTGSNDYRQPGTITELTANLRGADEKIVKELASALIDAINRVQIGNNGYWGVQIPQMIPPESELDDYNLPAIIMIKSGEELD